jgi:hypothetical protein
MCYFELSNSVMHYIILDSLSFSDFNTLFSQINKTCISQTLGLYIPVHYLKHDAYTM